MFIFVKRILIYVILVAILKSLVDNPSYSRYFKFFSGLILLLLMLSPMLHFLSGDTDLCQVLEEKIGQMDFNEEKLKIHMTEGKLEQVITSQCEDEITKCIVAMAQKRKIVCEKAEVVLIPKEEVQIKSVTAYVRKREDGSYRSRLHQLKKDICSYYMIDKSNIHFILI